MSHIGLTEPPTSQAQSVRRVQNPIRGISFQQSERDRLTGTAEEIAFLKIIRSIDATTASSVGHARLAYALPSLSVALADTTNDSGNVAVALLITYIYVTRDII